MDVEEKFDELNFEAKNKYISTRYKSGMIAPITTFLTNFSNITIYMLGIYMLGIYMLINHEIQLGTLLTIIIYGKLLTKPIRKTGNSLNSIETSFASIKRIFDIVEFYKK